MPYFHNHILYKKFSKFQFLSLIYYLSLHTQKSSQGRSVDLP
jgi:hypothetical protein